MGAAYDGRATCQDPLLTLMAEDAATSARTAELACIAVHGTFGGLPDSMTDEHMSGSRSSRHADRLPAVSGRCKTCGHAHTEEAPCPLTAVLPPTPKTRPRAVDPATP